MKPHAFISKLDKGLTQGEKVCAVYYYLLHELTSDSSESYGVSQDWDIYVTLACNMLNELGVPNLLMVDETPAGKNFWNLVQVDHNWYHLDVTTHVFPKGSIQYPLVSDEILGLTHFWEIERYPSQDKFLGVSLRHSFSMKTKTKEYTKRDYS